MQPEKGDRMSQAGWVITIIAICIVLVVALRELGSGRGK
jgi:hypothetical protein